MINTFFTDYHHQCKKVLLVRVGDFFESFGVDAVMLVEHAGLNPMGGRARAGCPWRNVQATLDGLVDAYVRPSVRSFVRSLVSCSTTTTNICVMLATNFSTTTGHVEWIPPMD